MTSDVKYHDWIKEERKRLFPKKTKFEKDNIQYDIAKNTQDYLYTMFYVAEKLEEMNKVMIAENAINNIKNKQIRLFNVLPLRTNIIPKHITLDTCAIISTLLDKTRKDANTKKEKKIKEQKNADEPKVKYSEKCKNKVVNNVYDISIYNYTKNNNQFMVWNNFFKLNKRTFKKNKYQFNFMIRTDGVSICILFVLLENGKPMSKVKGKQLNGTLECNYIENNMTNEII